MLFGEVAREGQLTADGLGVSRIFVGKHFQRMFFGGEVSRYPSGYIAALLLTAGAWFLTRSSGAANLRHGPAMVLYFGPCWWLLCLAPLVVVGYESTRHVYLAAVGWAIVLGLVFHALWHVRHAAFRYATLAASAGLFVFYTVRLQAEVADWNVRARVSQKVVADLEREALCGARRKPADCRRAAAELGVVAAVRRATAVHRDRSRRTGGDRLAGAARLLPGSMDGAHATDHPHLVATGVRAAVALRWDARTGAYSRVDRSRGPCAPESGDGAARPRYVRSPGSSHADDPPTGPVTCEQVFARSPTPWL